MSLGFCLKALKVQDELEIAYKNGLKLDESPHLEKVSSHPNIFWQFLSYLRYVTSHGRLRVKIPRTNEVFSYCETHNQMKSLRPLINSLADRGKRTSLVIDKKLTHKSEELNADVTVMSFSVGLIVTSLVCIFLRMGFLTGRTQSYKHQNRYKKQFNRFFRIYAAILYFHKILQKTKPKLVLIANDHNCDTRSLRLTCELMGIKTAFVQHGSGTQLNPPLRFDYVFLDGLCSFEGYTNKPEVKAGYALEMPKRVFLSGKMLQRNNELAPTPSKSSESLKIGIGVNKLDDFEVVKRFMESVQKVDPTVSFRIRTHPAQDQEFLKKLSDFRSTSKSTEHSEGHNEPLSEYFQLIDVLVAANTSLHLEAMLLETVSYYYEFSDTVEIRDYYRFIHYGLIKDFPSWEQINTQEKLSQIVSIPAEQKEAIRKFCESHGTKWYGRESELVARTCALILNDKNVDELFCSPIQNIQPSLNLYHLKNETI